MNNEDIIALANKIREHNEAVVDMETIEAFTIEHVYALADFIREQGVDFNRRKWIEYILKGKGA